MKKWLPIDAPGWMSMPGRAVGVLAHDARHDRLALLVEHVRDAIGRDREERGERRHDLAVAARRRVLLEGGLHVRGDVVPDLRQPLENAHGLLAADQRRDDAVHHAQIALELRGGAVVGHERAERAERVLHAPRVGEHLAAGLAHGIALLTQLAQGIGDEGDSVRHAASSGLRSEAEHSPELALD